MLTPQQVFDNALNGVRSQGGPSLKQDGICAYRGKGGARCGVGWSIPDDVYESSMDDTHDSSISYLLGYNSYRKLLALFSGVPLPLLQDLQSAHDQASGDMLNGLDAFMPAFERRMQQVAARYGLTYTPLADSEGGEL